MEIIATKADPPGGHDHGGAPPPELPPLVDSHCHLTWESFDSDRDEVVARMRQEGVVQAVVVATSVSNGRDCAALSDDHPGLYTTMGIHPNDIPADVDAALGALPGILAGLRALR